jgi:hypothetical protein
MLVMLETVDARDVLSMDMASLSGPGAQPRVKSWGDLPPLPSPPVPSPPFPFNPLHGER